MSTKSGRAQEIVGSRAVEVTATLQIAEFVLFTFARAHAQPSPHYPLNACFSAVPAATVDGARGERPSGNIDPDHPGRWSRNSPRGVIADSLNLESTARVRKKTRRSDEIRAAIIDEAARWFGPNNPYGVTGYQLGPRVRRGNIIAGRRTLRVFVHRKVDEPRHVVPKLQVRVGKSLVTVAPDVIAVGDFVLGHATSIPAFSGLHPGAVIMAEGARSTRYGAAALLLSTGSGLSHLLTVGHLFDRNEGNVAVFGAEDDYGQRIAIGTLTQNFLDRVDTNIGHPIDVALVSLNPDGVALASDSEAGRWPRICDISADDDGGGTEVVAFLPTTNDYSPSSTVDSDRVQRVTVTFKGRGEYDLEDVWRVPSVGDRDGDSGTCLVTQTSQTALVGICVGGGGQASIFEPGERAVAAAGRAINQPLYVWKRAT